MYTLEDVIDIRDKIIKLPDTDYCNVLSDRVWEFINKNQMKYEGLIQEDWEEYAPNKQYQEYAIERIQRELNEKGIAFVQLANSTGHGKTFIHEFVLFNTNTGPVRLESYGQDEIYEVVEGKAKRLPGYVLYCGRILEWPNWENDITTLLTISPGPERLNFWNGLFSANEKNDTDQQIDIIIFQPWQ
jgi:hypothetical protein